MSYIEKTEISFPSNSSERCEIEDQTPQNFDSSLETQRVEGSRQGEHYENIDFNLQTKSQATTTTELLELEKESDDQLPLNEKTVDDRDTADSSNSQALDFSSGAIDQNSRTFHLLNQQANFQLSNKEETKESEQIRSDLLQNFEGEEALTKQHCSFDPCQLPEIQESQHPKVQENPRLIHYAKDFFKLGEGFWRDDSHLPAPEKCLKTNIPIPDKSETDQLGLIPLQGNEETNQSYPFVTQGSIASENESQTLCKQSSIQTTGFTQNKKLSLKNKKTKMLPSLKSAPQSHKKLKPMTSLILTRTSEEKSLQDEQDDESRYSAVQDAREKGRKSGCIKNPNLKEVESQPNSVPKPEQDWDFHGTSSYILPTLKGSIDLVMEPKLGESLRGDFVRDKWVQRCQQGEMHFQKQNQTKKALEEDVQKKALDLKYLLNLTENFDKGKLYPEDFDKKHALQALLEDSSLLANLQNIEQIQEKIEKEKGLLEKIQSEQLSQETRKEEIWLEEALHAMDPYQSDLQAEELSRTAFLTRLKLQVLLLSDEYFQGNLQVDQSFQEDIRRNPSSQEVVMKESRIQAALQIAKQLQEDLLREMQSGKDWLEKAYRREELSLNEKSWVQEALEQLQADIQTEKLSLEALKKERWIQEAAQLVEQSREEIKTELFLEVFKRANLLQEAIQKEQKFKNNLETDELFQNVTRRKEWHQKVIQTQIWYEDFKANLIQIGFQDYEDIVCLLYAILKKCIDPYGNKLPRRRNLQDLFEIIGNKRFSEEDDVYGMEITEFCQKATSSFLALFLSPQREFFETWASQIYKSRKNAELEDSEKKRIHTKKVQRLIAGKTYIEKKFANPKKSSKKTN